MTQDEMWDLIVSQQETIRVLSEKLCTVSVPVETEKKRSPSATRMARHRHNKRHMAATSDTESDAKSATRDGISPSSYKGDLESKKEPFKALSTTLSGVSKHSTQVVTCDAAVTPENVTRLHIDPNGEDRDWRAMMKPIKREMS